MYDIYSRASAAANSSTSSSRTHEARVSVAVRSACVGLIEPFVHVLDCVVCFLVPALRATPNEQEKTRFTTKI